MPDSLPTASNPAAKLSNSPCMLFNFGPIVMFQWLPEEGWPVVGVSENVLQVLGYSVEQLLAGRPAYSELIHHDDLPRIAQEVDNYLRKGQDNYAQRYRLRHADGHWLWIDDYNTVQRDENGKATALYGYVMDVSDQHQIVQRLRMTASVFSHASEGVVITDTHGNILEVNQAFTRITGYSAAEVLGKNPSLLKSGRQSLEFYSQMWQRLLDHGHWEGEVWNRRKDGEVYAEWLSINAVTDNEGHVSHYVALFTDITSLKEHQIELERIAHYDTLTGLPNRTLLADRMRVALAHSRRSGEAMALCLLDLDGFKPVNDSLGHKAGDYVLQEIARKLEEGVRDDDTVARIGGDEFVLLLSGLHAEHEYEQILQRLLANISLPIGFEGQVVRVSASIGVTLYPGDSGELDKLLRHADQAMYRAKQEGKNRYHLFNPSAESRLHANRGLRERISKGINQGQFELYYQPKVDCRQGQVVGFEALLRWNHPTLGQRSPAEFLPLLEQEESIIELGDWVLAEAIRQIGQWRQQGIALPLSVNVSARQFLNGNLATRLESLQESAEASLLVIELVETAALEDVQALRQLLTRFQPHGMKFSLDDFGTGYSSLVHLKQLPVNEMKIDSSFVRDMLDDAGDLAIIQGVIGLAKAFDHEVVAEGVESIEHILMLLELGCDVMQGYAIARPMPAERIPAWLKNFSADPRWRLVDQGYPKRDDFELLLMEVGHRHWLDRLLHARPHQHIHRDYQQCPLSEWYNSPKAQRFTSQSGFEGLGTLHRKVHALADALAAARDAGESAQLEALSLSLHQANNALVDRLHQLRVAQAGM